MPNENGQIDLYEELIKVFNPERRGISDNFNKMSNWIRRNPALFAQNSAALMLAIAATVKYYQKGIDPEPRKIEDLANAFVSIFNANNIGIKDADHSDIQNLSIMMATQAFNLHNSSSSKLDDLFGILAMGLGIAFSIANMYQKDGYHNSYNIKTISTGIQIALLASLMVYSAVSNENKDSARIIGITSFGLYTLIMDYIAWKPEKHVVPEMPNANKLKQYVNLVLQKEISDGVSEMKSSSEEKINQLITDLRTAIGENKLTQITKANAEYKNLLKELESHYKILERYLAKTGIEDEKKQTIMELQIKISKNKNDLENSLLDTEDLLNGFKEELKQLYEKGIKNALSQEIKNIHDDIDKFVLKKSSDAHSLSRLIEKIESLTSQSIETINSIENQIEADNNYQSLYHEITKEHSDVYTKIKENNGIEIIDEVNLSKKLKQAFNDFNNGVINSNGEAIVKKSNDFSVEVRKFYDNSLASIIRKVDETIAEYKGEGLQAVKTEAKELIDSVREKIVPQQRENNHVINIKENKEDPHSISTLRRRNLNQEKNSEYK